MSKQRIALFLLLAVVVFVVPLLLYVQYIERQKSTIERSIYANEIAFMHKSVASFIEEKKKATTAIAITLASNDALYRFVGNKERLQAKIDALAKAFDRHTDYKHVWFHIVDKDFHSIYKSWGDTLDKRVQNNEFSIAITKQKIISFLSVDQFGVSIKAVAPFFDNEGNVAGAVEVISHFNSITKRLQKLDIDSMVVVPKKISQQLITQPFTKHFMDGCYIANLDISQEVLAYVRAHSIAQVCHQRYQIQDGYIILAYPLKDLSGDTIAYYIMLKKTGDISKTDLQFFLFKGVVFGFGLLGLFFITLLMYFLLRTRKLKKYYKSIIDSTTNILLICEGYKLISVNKIFFKYFKKYKNIKEFTQEHNCICDYFVPEDGYLQRMVDGEYWMDYIRKHPKLYHKAKLSIDGEIFYFSISLSIISQEMHRSSIILSDITEQELYKKELEYLTLSDPLTHVGNRRKYEKRIAEEISRACRYKTPLSLIVFDLDHFKRVNDNYGHTTGDEVLQEYSKLIAASLRDIDEVFRIGGEEFVIIAPHTKKEDALALAEKLRKLIQNNQKIVPVTASFGVTEYKRCEDKESFFTRADKALYAAKADGRNRVVVL